MTTGNAAGMTLLIACNSQALVDEIIAAVPGEQCHILIARKGQEAIGLLADHPETALAILTTELDGLNGFDTATEMKKIKPRVTVILLPSRISLEKVRLAAILDCDEIIQLPVRKEVMKAILMKYLPITREHAIQ